MKNVSILVEGIAIGKPLLLEDKTLEITLHPIAQKDVEQEVRRYQRALDQTKLDLEKIGSLKSNEQSQQVFSIMQAHLQILKDPLLTKEVENKIRSAKTNAEFALKTIIEEWRSLFTIKNEPFFQERAKEIQGLSKRVLYYLSDPMGSKLFASPDAGPYIIFTTEVTATDILEADPNVIKGFVTTLGESTSHATIIAKAKGFCFLSNVNLNIDQIKQAHLVIVDANQGEIHFDPPSSLLNLYLQKQQTDLLKIAHWKKMKRELIIQNKPVILRAAIEFFEELDLLEDVNAQGIGLVRSEFFLNRGKTLLSFAGQESLYQKIASVCAPHVCVFRTLDISYEEFALLIDVPPPKNPALSYRGLRWLLENVEIFKQHIRAMVLASRFGNVRIMLPMVSDLSEFIEAKKIVQAIQKECIQSGIPLPVNLLVGTMIEVPSAAILCDQFAKYADFFCVGTSDLMQYTLAIDRSECVKRDLFCPMHPAILRLIKQVNDCANSHNLPLILCGAAVQDPKNTALFLGLGIREFALSPRIIPKIRSVIGCLDDQLIEKITSEALMNETGQQMCDYLDRQYQSLCKKMDQQLNGIAIS